MDRIYDVIILGGGAAGYTAAMYAARGGHSVLVIEKMAPGGQMMTTDIIDNYPGYPDGIEGFALSMQMQKGAERFGAASEYAQVHSVELQSMIKTVQTDSGVYRGKTVIVATGAAPKELGIEKEKELSGKGVHYCAHCDGRFYKDKTVVVVGGGNSAVSDALYLAALAKKVYLVHRRDSLRATKIYHEPLFQMPNVEFLWNSVPSALLGDAKLTGIRVRDVNLQSEREIPCDGVFVSIGRRPETELLAGQVTLDENGYVIADESTSTNLAGVFAAGDVRTKQLRQVITAASDGAVAASMAEQYLWKMEM